MLKSLYEFEVRVNGRSAKEYYHEGRNYIEGKEGSRFSLYMRNNTGGRVLFVPTVDGLSIMNGKEGSFKSRGYIVNGYDSLTIDGWRTSDDKVAEFFFSTPGNSYAKKKGKAGNLGVIGCAVFKEKYYPPVYTYTTTAGATINTWPNWTSVQTSTTPTVSCNYLNVSQAGSAGLTKSPAWSETQSLTASAGLGTGFGQDKYSPTVTVSFEKEPAPTEVFSLYYNTRENLEAMGIEFRKPVYTAPSAFPNEDGYCERP